jgi:hypothetical protein
MLKVTTINGKVKTIIVSYRCQKKTITKMVQWNQDNVTLSFGYEEFEVRIKCECGREHIVKL